MFIVNGTVRLGQGDCWRDGSCVAAKRSVDVGIASACCGSTPAAGRSHAWSPWEAHSTRVPLPPAPCHGNGTLGAPDLPGSRG